MPRSLLLSLAVLLALGVASPVLAEPAAEPAPAAVAEPAPAAAPLPPAELTEPKYKIPEKLTHRPSGFWTSNRPAQGGAYRYGKLIIGAILVVITGVLMLLLARKHAKAPRPAWPTRHDGGNGAS